MFKDEYPNRSLGGRPRRRAVCMFSRDWDALAGLLHRTGAGSGTMQNRATGGHGPGRNLPSGPGDNPTLDIHTDARSS